MPIPTAGSIVHEFLRQIADGKSHNANEVRERLMRLFSISDEETQQRLPGGSESVVTNRFRNEKYRISSQGLAVFEESGNMVSITEKGKEMLKNASGTINYTATIPKRTR